MSDESELIDRCKRGDAEAWDEIFDAHYAAAGRFIFQLSADFSHEDADEICQEAFLSVIKNIGTFRRSSRFRTWLFRIAANRARDFIEQRRAAKRGGGHDLAPLTSEDENGVAIDPPDHQPAPDASLLSSEQMLLVRGALEQLGDPCREIIELRYYGDLSYEEIAGELLMNTKTVSSRLSKCLGQLEKIARPLFFGTDSPYFPV